jgi:hypothetical protein
MRVFSDDKQKFHCVVYAKHFGTQLLHSQHDSLMPLWRNTVDAVQKRQQLHPHMFSSLSSSGMLPERWIGGGGWSRRVKQI